MIILLQQTEFLMKEIKERKLCEKRWSKTQILWETREQKISEKLKLVLVLQERIA